MLLRPGSDPETGQMHITGFQWEEDVDHYLNSHLGVATPEASPLVTQDSWAAPLLFGHNSSVTSRECGKRFAEAFREKISNLDSSPIRGEYKLWILRRFLIPSFHFTLAVDAVPVSSIRRAQSLCTRKIKTWLGLSRGTTTAVLHHPNVIDIPTLSEFPGPRQSSPFSPQSPPQMIQ